ncbi:unnamed protein product [Rotaria socialis]
MQNLTRKTNSKSNFQIRNRNYKFASMAHQTEHDSWLKVSFPKAVRKCLFPTTATCYWTQVYIGVQSFNTLSVLDITSRKDSCNTTYVSSKLTSTKHSSTNTYTPSEIVIQTVDQYTDTVTLTETNVVRNHLSIYLDPAFKEILKKCSSIVTDRSIKAAWRCCHSILGKSC